MTTTSQELPPGTQLHEYTIERTLGQGGFGITYLATDNILNTRVVIKENLPLSIAHRDSGTLQVQRVSSADPDDTFGWSVRNFLEEARTLASLNHPNIVKVLRAFEANGTAYFVMPFVEGESLDKLTRRLSEAELRDLLGTLLRTLNYLHGKGLLHRDVKPGNILLTEETQPILIDFGSARCLLSEKTQTALYSPGYTPFEQIQHHGKVGAWTDIYSLGATLCKLITGDTPIGGADPQRRLADRPELTARYSGSFLRGIDKAVAVLPEERWQTAEEWLKALNSTNAAAGTRVVIPAPVPTPKESQRPARKTETGGKWYDSPIVSLPFAMGCGALLFSSVFGSLFYVMGAGGAALAHGRLQWMLFNNLDGTWDAAWTEICDMGFTPLIISSIFGAVFMVVSCYSNDTIENVHPATRYLCEILAFSLTGALVSYAIVSCAHVFDVCIDIENGVLTGLVFSTLLGAICAAFPKPCDKMDFWGTLFAAVGAAGLGLIITFNIISAGFFSENPALVLSVSCLGSATIAALGSIISILRHRINFFDCISGLLLGIVGALVSNFILMIFPLEDQHFMCSVTCLCCTLIGIGIGIWQARRT